jgi:hypothetical protein
VLTQRAEYQSTQKRHVIRNSHFLDAMWLTKYLEWKAVAAIGVL